MADKEEVVRIISELVNDAGRMLGSRLAMELKARVPDWSAKAYGARSLREFIASEVDGVVVAGRSGMDMIYSDGRSVEDSKDSLNATAPPDAWRAWVSPNSPFALSVRRDDGQVTLLPRGEDEVEGHVRIPPATVADHRAVGSAFVERVPEKHRSRLIGIVEDGGDDWWRHWLTEMRQVGVLGDWNAFRRERLQELLRTRLSDAGMKSPSTDAAVRLIASSGVRRSGKGNDHQPARHFSLRNVVAAVVERMSEAELRDLKLPVGLVLDAIGEIER